MSNERTLRVTGKGSLKLRPDTTVIYISVEGCFPEYADAMSQAAWQSEELVKALSLAGFEKKELKTTDFSVDTEYENYEENGFYRRRMVGYRFRHQMRLEFLSERKNLGEVLGLLAGCEANPEFSVSYTVKDKESATNELIARAVADAKEKAVILSEAAGIKLGEIMNIDYSWGTLNFEVAPVSRMMAKSAMGNSFDFSPEPEDIDLQDTVTVVWCIE